MLRYRPACSWNSFGAAGEVTGSCHILRVGGAPAPAGLRHDPGRRGRPGAQSAGVSLRRRRHRRRGAEPRAHRSLRTAAAAGASADSAGLSTPTRPAPTCCPSCCATPRTCDARSRARQSRRCGRRARVDAAVRSRGCRSACCARSRPSPYDTPREVLPGVTVQVREAGPHPRFLERRAVGRRRRACGASWCSRAISASTTRPSCRIRGASSPPTWCSWRAPTATAGIAAARTPSASSAPSSRRRRATAAMSSCRPSPSAAARSCSIYSRSTTASGTSRAGRSSSTVPMAIAASRVYWKHPDRFDEEASRLRASFRGMPPLPNLVLSETAGRVARHQQRPRRRHHHRRQRHGQWRPRPASPQAQPGAARVPRGHRRLPGAGHAGPPARGSRSRRCSSTASRVRVRRAGAYARRTLGARRPGATPALV